MSTLHQFRFIRQHPDSKVGLLIANHTPQFTQFALSGRSGLAGVWHFVHELAHCIDMVCIRNQPERLMLQNFGWPLEIDLDGNEQSQTVVSFTKKAATNECNVLALQELLMDKFNVESNEKWPTAVDFSQVLQGKLFWKNPDHSTEWTTEKPAMDRITENMELYRPHIDEMLQKTVDYICDNCVNLL